jgi:peptidoglycan/LPS O-acetylase OafA/YrhL
MTEVRSRTFPVLDTMRAVGALGVLATHCAFSAGTYTDWGAWGRALARMDAGVALFFVLSGFLLCRHWLSRAMTGQPGPSVTHYAWKRFLRIYPVYIVCAVIALTLIPENAGLGPQDWLETFGMAGIYVSDVLPHGLTQTWSLNTEAAFYIVLPLLMVLALGRRGRTFSLRRIFLVLAGMVAFNVAWLLGLADQVDLGTGQPREWLPAYLTWFAIGIWLSVVELSPESLPRTARALRAMAASPGSCWAAALGIFLVAGTSVAGPTALIPATTAEILTKNLLYASVATLLVIPGVFGPEGSTYHRLMSQPALRHLGHISYSIFLIHMPILTLVMAVTDYELFGGHLFQIFGLTLVLTLLASEVLYRLVERPAMLFRVPERERSIETLEPEPEAADATQTAATPSAASTR